MAREDRDAAVARDDPGLRGPDWPTLAALLALSVLALGLRAIRIDFESIWYDEMHSLIQSSRSFGELWAGLLRDTHPPLYFWLLGAWRRLAGESVASARLFSALWAAAMVPASYLLARSLRCERRVALVTAGLATFVPFTIYHGQQIRMYTLLTTLGALQLAWAGRILRQLEAEERLVSPRRLAELAGWCGLATLLVYVHNYGIFLCACATVWSAIEAWVQRRWRPLLVFAGLGLACLLASSPQLLRALYTMEQVRNFDWLRTAGALEINTPWRVAEALLAGPLLDPGPPALRWLLVLGATAGAVWLWRTPAARSPNDARREATWRRRTPLLLASCLVAAPLAVSLLRPIVLHGQRYMVYCVPLVLVVLGQIGVALRPALRWVALALIASVWLPYLWSFYGERQQIDLEAATRELQRLVRPESDAVLVWPGMNHRVVKFLSQERVAARPLWKPRIEEILADREISRVWLLTQSAGANKEERTLHETFRAARSRRWETDRRDTQLRLTLYERR